MSKMANNRRGFTLIEILVVMAISVILMGLVLYPVLQSFALTRRAQAMVDAQDAARAAMEQISRELGQAMFVYDNAATPIDLPVAVPGGPGGFRTGWFKLNFAKIDFVLPKIVMHCNNPNHPSGDPRDYPRTQLGEGGKVYHLAEPPCPHCLRDGLDPNDVEARPRLPLEQEVTVVRYFLGLAKNRLAPDNRGWLSPWGKNVEDGTENQVVLYRVEFSPYDEALFGPRPTNRSDAEWVQDNLSDPRFFYPEDPTRAQAWADAVRVVGIGKYEDLVIATRDSDGNIKSIEPTITFRTSAIDNDTFAGTYSSDVSFEYPNCAPTLYTAAYGYWTPGYRVVLYRDDPETTNADPYEIAYATDIDYNGHLVIYKWTQAGSGNWNQSPHFDITAYMNTGDIAAASLVGGDELEMAFTVDPNRGAVNFSLRPPARAGNGSVSDLDPVLINQAYHGVYRNDPASARRYALLSTFDPSSPGFLKYARIVPGSERVIGPNMIPGSGGRLVLYRRTPREMLPPELNQYRIDYDTGEIYFSSVYNQDIPETGKILVDYSVYFNRIDDVVKGDYSTKSLVTIHLGMRMFDPESNKPHPVDLNKSVKIRNALR